MKAERNFGWPFSSANCMPHSIGLFESNNTKQNAIASLL